MSKPPRKPRPTGRQERTRKVGAIPDASTVVSEAAVTSPKGTTFRILRTTQADAYDKPKNDKPARDNDH
jgi:hypothetical protein